MAAFAAYANNLGNSFAMDDHYNVVTNESIRTLSGVAGQLTQAWGAGAADDYSRDINVSYWRPVVAMSYGLDYAIWGLQPGGFHLTNNLLHAGVSALVVLLLFGLVGGVGALFGGLVFALHPVHTEAVDLVSYRTELMAALFAVSALVVHLRAESATARRRAFLLWLPLLYALGLASKETAVTLPGWLLVIDVWRAHRDGAGFDAAWLRRIVRDYLPLSAVLVGYLLVRRALLTPSTIDFLAGVDGALAVMSVMKLYLHNVHLLFVPWPLTPFYDWTIVAPAGSLTDLQAMVGLLVFASTVAVMVVVRRRAPLVSVGLAWWLLGLIPFMHLVPIPVGVAERFLYLPGVGAVVLVGVLAARLQSAGKPIRGAAIAVATLLVGLMITGTVVRNQAWRTDRTLLEQATADFPGSFNAHFGLGELHFGAQRYAEAADSFAAADEILPAFTPNVLQLARALDSDGRSAAALAALDRAIRARGPDPALLQARQALLRRDR